MSYPAKDAVQLLTPLREGVLNLQRRFPDWKEVRQLAEDVTAVEQKLTRVSPRLLGLVGKGTPMSLKEENAFLSQAVADKHGS